MPPTAEIPETNLKVITGSSTQVESSRRVKITRELSREDAIAATMHFFTTVDEKRNTAELLVVTTTDGSQMNVPTCPWTYLPNGITP